MVAREAPVQKRDEFFCIGKINERLLTWTSLPAETPDEHLPVTRKKQPHEILVNWEKDKKI